MPTPEKISIEYPCSLLFERREMRMTPMVFTWNLLTDPLVQMAENEPDKVLLHFVDEAGGQTDITAAEMHRRAVDAARALAFLGLRPGDLIILSLRHCRELVDLLWGCLYLRVIPAVFPYLTEKIDPDIFRHRIHQLVTNSGAALVVTFPEFKDELASIIPSTTCRVISTAELPAGAAGPDSPAVLAPVDPAAVAMIQYSSGTTGLQKGIPHSHRDLLTGLQSVADAIELRPDDAVVNWLPLFHDMGMLVGFLLPIIAGIRSVLMSPFYWIRSPRRLLQAIQQLKGTLCWMPNFAFNHSVRSISPRDLTGLDLSHWRMLMSSSEPVRHDSMQQFLETFAPYGFREEALAVGYGTTETTGASTMTPVGRPPRIDWIQLDALQLKQIAVPAAVEAPGALPVYSCGRPLAGVELRIVDAQGQALPERVIGEVLHRAPHLFHGYLRAPEETARALRNGWFHTGDLGYLAEGELFVCGRKKDLIISGGKNIYPEDIEEIANNVPGIYPGRSVAFGVNDPAMGTESVVVVAELRHEVEPAERWRIERELRRMVVQDLGISLSDVKLLPEKGWVIKTTNGKIARSANRDKYLHRFADGRFAAADAMIPRPLEIAGDPS
jgi:fatty-acyl-CoA synthase